MKKIIFLFSLFVFNYSLSQTEPKVYLVTTEKIVGSSELKGKIYIDINSDGQKDHTIDVDTFGKFIFKFPAALNIGDKIQIWLLYEKKNLLLQKKIFETEKKSYTVKSDDMIVDEYVESLKNESAVSLKIRELDAKNLQLKNTILSHKATISNTYFQIPLVRFNLVDEENKIGNINLFNSIGAGVGINWGRMEITRDNNGQIINEEFSSTFGFHVGALFSADTGEESKNVFAPTFNVSILDFQIGVGYELGTVSDNQKRTFITLAYSIPLYKLVKKSYRVWKINPIPYESRKSILD